MSTADSSGVTIRSYTADDEPSVVALWRGAGLVVPWNDPHKDVARKQSVQRDLFLVATEAGRVVGTAMAGYDGHRGWINYLAVAGDCRRGGIGRELMAEAERRLADLGCPKVNVQIRTSNRAAVGFYEAIGFRPDDVVSMGKRLETD